MPRANLLLLILVWIFQVPFAAAEETAFSPSLITASDLLKIRQLDSPTLSPDGRWVVYVVRSIEPKPGKKDDWIYRNQLWIAAVDGTTPPRPLTFAPSGGSQPVWSPQGDRLAFVRTDEKEKSQVFVLPITGGEAMPLTRLETGASRPRWSPDGARILFTTSLSHAQLRAALEKEGRPSSPIWSSEKPARKLNDTANWGFKSASEIKATDGEKSAEKPSAASAGSLLEIREWLAQNEADNNPRVTDRLNFLEESDLKPMSDFRRFYVIEAREGAEPTAVTLDYSNFSDPEWLPDGKRVVCLGPRKNDENPDRAQFNSLYLIEIESRAATVLLEETDNYYNSPLPSPDGSSIAYTVTTGGEYSFDQDAVATLPSAGGTPKILSADLDRSAENLKWSPDGTAIYFSAASQGRFPLYRITLESGKLETLTTDSDWGIRNYAVGTNHLVQIVTNPGNPWELYVADVSGKESKPLTTHNSEWLKDRKLSPYEPHRLVNLDGISTDFWTLKPANFDPTKKYPLLLNIHGGPSAMWGPGEASSWHEMQFFAARGYAVVFANPRGSGGYGRDFQRANYRDWGKGPSSDVLAAANFAAKENYIDTSRQVITGGSYGGYLVAWIVGHDQRFKAAVAQRGVYDLATFYGEGNAWSLIPRYWGGYPWEKEIRRLLDRDSPLTYVEAIKTPLLIKHGDTDFRTGVIQSQILYKSLKQLGRDVEYVRYPRATHELSRSGEPKQRIDRLVRFEEFFRRYIGEN